MQMFCKNCGAKVKEGGQFCPKCGSRIEESQSAAKQRNGLNKKAALGMAVVAVVLLFKAVFSPKSDVDWDKKDENISAVSGNVGDVLELDHSDEVSFIESIIQAENTEAVDEYTGVFTDEYYKLVAADIEDDRIFEQMYSDDTTDEDWERLAAAFQESVASYYREGSYYYDLVSMCYDKGFLPYDFCLEKSVFVTPDVLDGFDNNDSKYDNWDAPTDGLVLYDNTKWLMWKYSFPSNWKVRGDTFTQVVTDNGTEISYGIMDEKYGFEDARRPFDHIINGEKLAVNFSEVGLDSVTTGSVMFDVLKNSDFYYLDATKDMSVTHMPALVAYGSWNPPGSSPVKFVLTARHKLPREKYFENASKADKNSLDWLKFKNEVEYTVNIFDKDVTTFLQSIYNN